MSIVYQIGVIPTGAVAPLIATSLVTYFTGSVWPVAIYVMAMAVITLVSLYFLPETHQRDINDVHLTSPDGKLASHDLSATPAT
jgi:hypothetical protein